MTIELEQVRQVRQVWKILTPSLTKRLTLTRSLASRVAGTIIAGRQSAPRQNAGRWAREIFTTEYTEAVEPLLKDTETGLEGKTGLEDFNSEPNKRLRLTPPLASRGAGIVRAGRQSAPRQNTGRLMVSWAGASDSGKTRRTAAGLGLADKISEGVAIQVTAEAPRGKARPFNFATRVPFFLRENSAADDVAFRGCTRKQVRSGDEEFSGPGRGCASGFELDVGWVEWDAVAKGLDASAVVEDDSIEFACGGAGGVEDEFEGIA